MCVCVVRVCVLCCVVLCVCVCVCVCVCCVCVCVCVRQRHIFFVKLSFVYLLKNRLHVLNASDVSLRPCTYPLSIMNVLFSFYGFASSLNSLVHQGVLVIQINIMITTNVLYSEVL